MSRSAIPPPASTMVEVSNNMWQLPKLMWLLLVSSFSPMLCSPVAMTTHLLCFGRGIKEEDNERKRLVLRIAWAWLEIEHAISSLFGVEAADAVTDFLASVRDSLVWPSTNVRGTDADADADGQDSSSAVEESSVWSSIGRSTNACWQQFYLLMGLDKVDMDNLVLTVLLGALAAVLWLRQRQLQLPVQRATAAALRQPSVQLDNVPRAGIADSHDAQPRHGNHAEPQAGAIMESAQASQVAKHEAAGTSQCPWTLDSTAAAALPVAPYTVASNAGGLQHGNDTWHKGVGCELSSRTCPLHSLACQDTADHAAGIQTTHPHT